MEMRRFDFGPWRAARPSRFSVPFVHQCIVVDVRRRIPYTSKMYYTFFSSLLVLSHAKVAGTLKTSVNMRV